MEMKKYRLGEIAQLGSGSTPTSSIREYYDGGTIPWINSGELSNPFIAETNNYITELGFKHSSTKMYKKNDTVLLAMYGATAGKASLLQIDACTNQAICAIIPNKDVVEPVILKYKLDTIYQYLVKISTGSARDNLSQKGISNLEISLPNLDVQRKIAAVLSSLDHKIALNRRINAKLEQMAKRLYDYWFVQFDFPNAEGMPYKSSGGNMVDNAILKRKIPEGWEVKPVKDCIEPIERGISYTSEDIANAKGVAMFNLACFSKQGDYRTGELKFFNGAVNDCDKIYPFDMLIACTDMTQGADIIGRPILASKEFDLYTYSTDLAKITPKGIEKMYLYYSLRTPFYHKYIKPFASGTNVKHLNVRGVEDYLIIVPQKNLQILFDNFVRAIKDKQMSIINEIQRLTALRDKLLPLLMNGQVTVK